MNEALKTALEVLAAAGVSEFYEALFKWSVINIYHLASTTRSSARSAATSQSLTDAIKLARTLDQNRIELPIAVRLKMQRGDYFFLSDGFRALVEGKPKDVLEGGRVPPPDSRWHEKWSSKADFFYVYLLLEELPLHKVALKFHPPVKTRDGHALTGARITANVHIINPSRFVKVFLSRNRYIFDQQDFNSLLNRPFRKAFQEYAGQKSRGEIDAEITQYQRTENVETTFKAIVKKQLNNYGIDFEILDIEIEWDDSQRRQIFIEGCQQVAKSVRSTVWDNLYGRWQKNSSQNGVLWHQTLGEEVRGDVAFIANKITLTTKQGSVYQLELKGRKEKIYQGLGEFEVGPAVWENRVILANREGKVWITSLAMSEPLTRKNAHFDFHNTLRCRPGILNNKAFFSLYDKGIIQIEHYPNEHREYPLWIPQEGDYIKTAPLPLDDGTVFFVSKKGCWRWQGPSSEPYQFYSFPNDGRVASCGLAYDQGVLFVGHTKLGLAAIDTQKNQTLLGNIKGTVWTSPIIHNHIAFVGDDQGRILAINAQGENPDPRKWPMRISKYPIKSRPVVWRDILLAADTGGDVHAINLETGEAWWTNHVGGSVHAPLWMDMAAGILIVVNAAGSITALPWHYDKIDDAIQLLEQWRMYKQAGSLAFLYYQFELAMALWKKEKKRERWVQRIIDWCELSINACSPATAPPNNSLTPKDVPPNATPKSPRIHVEIKANLIWNSIGALMIQLSNVGDGTAKLEVLRIRSRFFEVYHEEHDFEGAILNPGQITPCTFHVKPIEHGNIPLDIELLYTDESGRLVSKTFSSKSVAVFRPGNFYVGGDYMPGGAKDSVVMPRFNQRLPESESGEMSSAKKQRDSSLRTITCPSCGVEQPATNRRCENPRCGALLS